jgi:hypothetical protein
MSASPSLRIAPINRGVFAAELKFFENIWRGGATLWVDVRSESAKIGRSLLDSGQRRQPAVRGGESVVVGGKTRVRDKPRREA